MQKRNIDWHHYGLPAIWGLKNAIRMPLFFWRLHTRSSPSDFFPPKSISHSVFNAVRRARRANEMGTWTQGPNLVTRARAMRTVRLLPQTPSNHVVLKIGYCIVYIKDYISYVINCRIYIIYYIMYMSTSSHHMWLIGSFLIYRTIKQIPSDTKCKKEKKEKRSENMFRILLLVIL